MAALDELSAVVFKWADMQRSIIKPALRRLSNIPYKWRLQLVEEWQTVDDAGNHVGSPQLDRCVKWVDEKLIGWLGICGILNIVKMPRNLSQYFIYHGSSKKMDG
jgi:hypothetical protein